MKKQIVRNGFKLHLWWHKAFTVKVQRWRRLTFLLMTVGQITGILVVALPARLASAASATKVIKNSSSPSVQTRWYTLRGYGNLNRNTDVYWPSRNDNCGGGGWKISPWQPEYQFSYSGNDINQSSNCADRYTDAGTTANGGAWIQPHGDGDWSEGVQTIGWNYNPPQSYSTVMGGCSGLSGGAAKGIWGSGGYDGRDTTDQFYTTGNMGSMGGIVNGLYTDLYPGRPRGAGNTLNLYSNGVTLVRDNFDLTAADIANIDQPGAHFLFQGYADDWLQVYINGTAAASSQHTTNGVLLDLATVKGSLHVGTNWLGVMVADKAVFANSDPGGRGAGVCYDLQYQYTPDFSLVAGVKATPFENGVAVGGTTAQIGDQIQFTYTVFNNSPGATLGPVGCTIYANKYNGSHGVPTPADTGPVDGPETAIMQGQCNAIIGPNGTVTVTETISVVAGDSGGTICRSLYVSPTSMSGGTSSAEACVSVPYRPYFTVLGGDISAGPGFGNGSCTEGAAAIESWNDNTSSVPNYFGGSSVYGALATGSITNFVSGLGLSGAPGAQSGRGLSFANANNGQPNSPPNYGGGFGAGSVPCIKDYYGTKAGSGATTINGPITAAKFNTLATNHSYIVTPDATGTVTLGAIAVAPGAIVTLYVQGNAYINGNIVYSNYTLDTVPRFNLYVQGSIYINPNVTELHGAYIAQQSGSYKGDIITCAANPADISESYNTCKKQLLVVGSMAAEGHIRLTRTYGNLEPAPGIPAAPAEIFQYSPELWLAAPPLTNLPIKTYTSLPPVL
ncbi:MAG TPA: hypothetical protein VLG92_00300 [Candidatus Saccharimonadia bacterium]|nr:hypothetical protein [Candidatus Saccharimonadia bacterium]